MDELGGIRRHYARDLVWRAGLDSQALEEAFTRVPRERFLGPGPWKISARGGTYRETPDDDPRHLCHDLLYAIVPERRLNNGQPSFLALLMHGADIQPGDHVVHLGAGVGYYSAVMAELTGPGGRITAVEADAELARRAVDNLADRSNVRACQGDGLAHDFDAADVIFVNFGVTHPLRRWIERLRPGGRLLTPITNGIGIGAVLRFDAGDAGLSARMVGPTQIFSSVSGRDPAREAKLNALYATGPMGAGAVASLRLDPHGEEASCWLHGDDVCLSTVALEQDPKLAPYVGVYRSDAGALDLTFSAREGRLQVHSAMGGAHLTAVGDDCFEAPGIAHFRFECEAERAVAVHARLGNSPAQRFVRDSNP